MGAGWHTVLELSSVRRASTPEGSLPCDIGAYMGEEDFPHMGGVPASGHRTQARCPCLREVEDWHGDSEPELVKEGISTRGGPVQDVRAVEGSLLQEGWPGLGCQDHAGEKGLWEGI